MKKFANTQGAEGAGGAVDDDGSTRQGCGAHLLSGVVGSDLRGKGVGARAGRSVSWRRREGCGMRKERSANAAGLGISFKGQVTYRCDWQALGGAKVDVAGVWNSEVLAPPHRGRQRDGWAG